MPARLLSAYRPKTDWLTRPNRLGQFAGIFLACHGVAPYMAPAYAPLVSLCFLTLAPLVAAWACFRRGGKQGQQAQQEQAEVTVQIGTYFGERQRRAVSDYYDTRPGGGKCPPGLAKKHNGCLPPGQAKKWQMGRPLDRDVAWSPVPQDVVVRIGLPPAGYRYVRVLNDILLVAIGSNMVVDAMEDLMR